jgi:hypothetical protein
LFFLRGPCVLRGKLLYVLESDLLVYAPAAQQRRREILNEPTRFLIGEYTT